MLLVICLLTGTISLLIMDREKILEVKNLKQYFPLDKNHIIKVVDDISFEIYKEEKQKC